MNLLRVLVAAVVSASEVADVPREFSFIEVHGNKRCELNIHSPSFERLFEEREASSFFQGPMRERASMSERIADGIFTAFLFFARRKECDQLFIPRYNTSRASADRKATLEARNTHLKKSSLFGSIFKRLERHRSGDKEDYYRPPMYGDESMDFVRDDEPFYRVMLFGRRKLTMKVQGSSKKFEVSPYWDRRELYSKDVIMWGICILLGAVNIAMTSGISAQTLVFLGWYAAAAAFAQYLFGPISHGNLLADFQSEN
ncbi:hypothetical protein XU18_3772 [Perkinsela sp. CCAP 1560/4]|nr:hypothetical protein XU18_3772 [Perkinsela sp. CCAP 1560/4]|eukprot:KNH05156.1 hypothetical protein XU18_3772 [Perkinsela sp. CCAP 1560/4]